MFQRIAARPLALTAALLLFPACDSGDGDGGTDTDASTSGTTEPGTSTTGPDTTTTGSGTTTTATTTAAETGSSGSEESSTGSEGSSSGSESGSSSTGGEGVGYADLYGEYGDGFGTHTLSAESWSLTYPDTPVGAQSIDEVNDEERWVAGYFDGDESVWLIGYSRFDWDFDDAGILRYCQLGSGSKTLQAAIDAPASDRTDFDGVGCNGFSWSALEPE